MATLTKKPQSRRYEAIIHPEMNEDMEKLEKRLHVAFEAVPVENGINHPGQIIIEEALQSTDEQYVLDWLKLFSLDTLHPHFATSVLKCLGRQEQPGTVSWRVAIIREALSADAVDIRDAAIQAAESWGGMEMLNILQQHNDSVPWIQKYVQKVIKDLSA